MTFQVRHETNLFDFIQTRQADKYSKFPNDKSNFYDEIQYIKRQLPIFLTVDTVY